MTRSDATPDPRPAGLSGAYVGVDFGTSVVKGTVISADGTVLSQHASTRRHTEAVDAAPEDPAGLWWPQFAEVVQSLLAATALDSLRLEGLAVTGMVPNVCLLDDSGVAVHPSLLFYDKRAYDIELELDRELRTERWQNEVLSKLIWLRSHLEDGTAGQRLRLVSTHNYLVLRLTGSYVIDTVTAAECGTIYLPDEGRWNTELLRRFGLETVELPRVVAPSEVVGTVGTQAAIDTGLPEGLPVVAGTADSVVSALGAGATARNDILVYYGTFNCAARLLAGMEDILDGRYRRYPLEWLTSVPRAGQQIRGFAELLFGGDDLQATLAQLDEAASRVPPGARGLLFLQAVDPDATTVSSTPEGALVYLSVDHGRAEIARAVLEAFAYWLRRDWERNEIVGLVTNAVAGGGGARSKVWRQIVSDVLGVSQKYLRSGDRGLGSALLALRGVGGSGAFDRILETHARTAEVTTPTVQSGYEQAYAEYCSLLAHLKGSSRP